MFRFIFDNTFHVDVAKSCLSFVGSIKHQAPLLILIYLVVLENGKVLCFENRSNQANLFNQPLRQLYPDLKSPTSTQPQVEYVRCIAWLYRNL